MSVRKSRLPAGDFRLPGVLYLGGTGDARPGTLRFLANPGDEPRYVGVGSQGLERVVLPLKFLVVEDGVYVPVTWRAEANRKVNYPPVEVLLVALVLVARPGDKMMPSQPLNLPVAELASSSLCAASRLVHLSDASILPTSVE